MLQPAGGTLPVISANSFASNFLNQRKREIIFPRKNVQDAGHCLRSGHAVDQANMPGLINSETKFLIVHLLSIEFAFEKINIDFFL